MVSMSGLVTSRHTKTVKASWLVLLVGVTGWCYWLVLLPASKAIRRFFPACPDVVQYFLSTAESGGCRVPDLSSIIVVSLPVAPTLPDEQTPPPQNRDNTSSPCNCFSSGT
ncbi:hypothetical protein RRG08_018585 [Elysia crispata]|uniref:Uncharacterized protein n=1 Tax=Elysia crispata TaxID=231223 RepID=A0AAE1DTD1_9GAST|nr:hypothetical protein RRG08_018585 [Elysia crispata]